MVAYHVTLNGQGYVLDLEKYEKRPHGAFIPRQGSGALSYQDLRGPEQVLRLTDWSGGEGQVQDGAVSANAYRSGSGIDVYSTPGAVQLGPYAVVSQTTSDGAIRCMLPYGGLLFSATDVGHVYLWNGVSWTLSATLGGGPAARSMEVYLNRLYVSNEVNGNLVRFDGSAWSLAGTASAAIFALRTHYRQAAQYLYCGEVGVGVNGIGRIYFFDGTSFSAGQFDPEEIIPLLAFTLGQRCYFVGADPSLGGSWSIYSVDDQGSGGVWRQQVRQVAQGFPVSATVVGGTVYLGDYLSGRIWTFDGTSVAVLRDLSVPGAAYAGHLYAIQGWRGALWVGVIDGSGVGLLRYDPISETWSRPVAGLTGTDARSLAVYADQLYLGTLQTGAAKVYRVIPSQYAASGQFQTGLIDAGLPGIPKLLRSVTIVTSAIVSPQSIQVEYQLEDTGAWVSLGTLSSVGATTATYTFAANTTARQVAFRVTLSGTAGASSSPVLYELVLRYVPRPAVTREWGLAVVLEGTAELPMVTLDQAPEPLTGAALTAALWTAAAATGPVTFVDLDGSSYQVYIDDVREEVGKISQRRGYQRLALVKLVEAA